MSEGKMTLLGIGNKTYKIPNDVMKAIEDMSNHINNLEEKNRKKNIIINEVIEDLQDTLGINNHIKIGNNELVQLDIDHIKYLIDRLRGKENE